MSTGVICSSFLSCNLVGDGGGEPSFRIGVQTQLLSIDHLSVNSLGEKRAIDFINPTLLYIDDKKRLKSHFGTIEFNGFSIKTSDSKLKQELKDSFLEIKNSALWGANFSQFVYDDEKGISCLLQNACIGKFITLVGILRSEEYAPYQLDFFIKGKEISLKAKENNLDLPNRIVLKRVKEVSDGVNFLKQNKIDVFYPHEKVSRKEKELIYTERPGRNLRLSLYYKYNENVSKSFFKAFCASIDSLRRSFSGWRLEFNSCENKRNIIFKDKMKIKSIGDSKLTNKFFDIVYQNKSKELDMDYKVLKPYNLTKVLKSGEFDLYMTEEIFDESFPALYEAFHSKGEFNTLNYKSEKLDKALQEAQGAESLKDFYNFQKKVKAIIKNEEPLLIRLKKKSYNAIYRKKDIESKKLNFIIQYLE